MGNTLPIKPCSDLRHEDDEERGRSADDDAESDHDVDQRDLLGVHHQVEERADSGQDGHVVDRHSDVLRVIQRTDLDGARFVGCGTGMNRDSISSIPHFAINA